MRKRFIAGIMSIIVTASIVTPSVFAAEGEISIKGDVNGDGAVTIEDIENLATKKYNITFNNNKSIISEKAADMNDDNKVDSLDFIYLTTYVAATENDGNYKYDFGEEEYSTMIKDAYRFIIKKSSSLGNYGEKYEELFDRIVDDFCEDYKITSTSNTEVSIANKTNEKILYGDMTQDGVIDARDATAILIWYAEKLLNE